MSDDDTTDDEGTVDGDQSAGDDIDVGHGDDGFDEDIGSGEDDGPDVRQRLEEEADKAVEQFDEGIVDLLSWVLETETRARIYVFLRQNAHSTSDEIADGTGLYPSTVREALAELHDEGKVSRRKRESDGAGNNPYEYHAMAPSELVGSIVDDVQSELNTVFNLDSILDGGDDADDTTESEPVTITVEDDAGAHDDSGSSGESEHTEDESEDDSDGEQSAEKDENSDGDGDDSDGDGGD